MRSKLHICVWRANEDGAWFLQFDRQFGRSQCGQRQVLKGHLSKEQQVTFYFNITLAELWGLIVKCVCDADSLSGLAEISPGFESRLVRNNRRSSAKLTCVEASAVLSQLTLDEVGKA